jgi:hypothetical protein
MEQITPSGSLSQQASQPCLIFQALVLTAILYLTAGLTLPNTRVDDSRSVKSSASLLESVTNAVLQEVSYQSGLPRSALRIIHAHQQTWSDECKGVNKLGILCTETQVPGWQVTVVSGPKRWVYQTNASGSFVKVDADTRSNVQKSGM